MSKFLKVSILVQSAQSHTVRLISFKFGCRHIFTSVIIFCSKYLFYLMPCFGNNRGPQLFSVPSGISNIFFSIKNTVCDEKYFFLVIVLGLLACWWTGTTYCLCFQYWIGQIIYLYTLVESLHPLIYCGNSFGKELYLLRKQCQYINLLMKSYMLIPLYSSGPSHPFKYISETKKGRIECSKKDLIL